MQKSFLNISMRDFHPSRVPAMLWGIIFPRIPGKPFEILEISRGPASRKSENAFSSGDTAEKLPIRRILLFYSLRASQENAIASSRAEL